MQNFVVTDRLGEPLARIKAPSLEQAESLALRRVVGAHRLVEVKSMSRADIEEGLRKSFTEIAGMSNPAAKIASTRTNADNLRTYEVSDTPDTSSSNESHSDVDAFVDRFAPNTEKRLYESFKAMGLSEKEARLAAEGRK